MVIDTSKYSFEKGLGEVKTKRRKAVKLKILEALDLSPSNKPGYIKYKKGTPSLTVAKKDAITEIFKQEGISNPWGKGDE